MVPEGLVRWYMVCDQKDSRDPGLAMRAAWKREWEMLKLSDVEGGWMLVESNLVSMLEGVVSLFCSCVVM